MPRIWTKHIERRRMRSFILPIGEGGRMNRKILTLFVALVSGLAVGGCSGQAAGSWRLSEGQDTLFIANKVVLAQDTSWLMNGPGKRSFSGCGGGIRSVSPNPAGTWLLVILQCFEDENSKLLFQADGSRWAIAPDDRSYTAHWAEGGRTIQYGPEDTPLGRLELSPTAEEYPSGEMRITYRVVDVRADDFLNIRQAPNAEAPIVARIPPTGRGIVLIKEGGVEVEGYFQGTGWLQILWGEQVGWVNGRYLRAVVGDREHVSSRACGAGGVECGH